MRVRTARVRGSSPTCRALLAFLVACSGSSSKPAPAAKKDAGPAIVKHEEVPLTVAHLPEPQVALPKLDSFTLLSPGKGARHALRYAVPAGSATFTAETKLRSRHLAHGTWSDTVDLPAITDGFTVSTADATKPTIFRATPATAAKRTPEAEAYLATWHAIENRVVQVKLDDRGQLASVVFADDVSGANSRPERDEVVQRLLLTLVPLPEEPIAPGAQWRVVTILRQRPAVVKQTATYTLVAASGHAWKIDAKIVRIAEEQVVSDPALPAGVVARVIAFVRTADATFSVSPSRVLPSGTLSIQSTLHVRFSAKGHDQEEQIFEDTGTITLK
jgi:hypothetical protein